MRGLQDKQTNMWAFVSIEDRIPSDHPLATNQEAGRSTAGGFVAVFNRMYSQVGRPSIAPERVLKSLLLIALYSVQKRAAVL